MVPQYYPWLFDDQNAWETAVADPRFKYDSPIDFFMALYQEHRTNAPQRASTGMPVFPTMPATSIFQSSAVPATQSASPNVLSSFPEQKPDPQSKTDDSVLSQDEIDALLAGL